MEQRFIEVFRLAALQAGAVASRLRGRVKAQRKAGERTLESSAVSAVDYATQDVILLALHAALPGVAVDAEEDTAASRLFPPEAAGRWTVVVDPVDGTLNYLRGSEDYAVMGALLRDGEFRAALIHLPERSSTWWAIRGEGCWREDARGERRRVGVSGAPDIAMITRRSPRRWRSRLQDVTARVVVSGCSAIDSAAPALGRARAAVSAGRPDRRRAIGYLLTEEAGGVVTLGGLPWAGADPVRLAREAGPVVVAIDAALAARVLAITRSGAR